MFVSRKNHFIFPKFLRKKVSLHKNIFYILQNKKTNNYFQSYKTFKENINLVQCNTQDIFKCTGWSTSTIQWRVVYLHVWLYNLQSSSYISAFHTRHSTVTVVQPVHLHIFTYMHYWVTVKTQYIINLYSRVKIQKAKKKHIAHRKLNCFEACTV